jgi:transcriptional regulator with XRE-family HTH domain
MQFGKIIRESRKSRNLTQSELGNMIGKTQGQISEWEKNVTEPSSEDKIKLCEALNLSLIKLYGIKNEYDEAITYVKDKKLSPAELIKAVEIYIKIRE